ncbi:MAG: hypothetical protein IJT36_00975 [Alphaproteobacteria bacterium]|nr:hypothetical protein [Alphaproteobacteria bacterium]
MNVDIVLFQYYSFKDMSKKNFFHIFNIPVSYKIDETELTKVYFQLQKKQYLDCPCKEGTATIDLSDLNIAYKTLINPIDRAEHFLEVQGVSIIDKLPMIFAEEMFEIRQQYELLQTDIQKKDFIADLKKRMAEIISSLHNFESDLVKFRDQTGLLRFINSFLEKVESNAYSRD